MKISVLPAQPSYFQLIHPFRSQAISTEDGYKEAIKNCKKAISHIENILPKTPHFFQKVGLIILIYKLKEVIHSLRLKSNINEVHLSCESIIKQLENLSKPSPNVHLSALIIELKSVTIFTDSKIEESKKPLLKNIITSIKYNKNKEEIQSKMSQTPSEENSKNNITCPSLLKRFFLWIANILEKIFPNTFTNLQI